jgi:CheY-like chemotaxis protein
MGPALVRILLIEDNPGDARLLKEYLPRNLPFELEIVHVQRLEQALTALERSRRYDLVLCDLFLPDSLGHATFERVRQAAPDTPIVVLSGWEDQQQVEKAIAEGACDYLSKANLDGLKLVRLLRETVKRSGPHSSLPS